MFIKNTRRSYLLEHRLLFYMLTVVLLSLLLLPAAFGQEDAIADAVNEGTSSIWAKVQLYGGVILVIFFFSALFYLIGLFRKDKLLKTLLNKYVVFQMKEENRRYRGTMRLELSGMEIISEESRQRGHAPSYIFTNKEREEQIVAYIRYHDAMNERELRERTWELERVYHPPFIYKMGRKIRNMFIALKEASKSAINMVLQNVKSGVSGQFSGYSAAYQQAMGNNKETDITGIDELKASDILSDQERYERLIERLVGTRIKVRTATGEYTAILKDYNEKHIALMDVKDGDNNGYRDQWGYEHEFKHDINALNRRDDRGLRVRAEGNDQEGYSLIFENNTPYQIRLGHVVLHDGAPQWVHNFEFKHHIAAFSVQKLPIRPVAKHKVGPFERITSHQPLTIRNYKKIKLDFLSFRDADIIFPRGPGSCTIVESAEKYQPELFSLGGLTDTVLDMRNTEDIVIADKDGNPIHGINVVHGYVTNVNEERIDLKTIDTSYGRRWDIENAFRRFDNKFRRGFPLFKRLLPINRAKITAHASIVEQIHDNDVRHEALAPLVYPARSLNTAEQRARRRKLIRNRIVGNVNATFNTKFWRPNDGVPKTPGVTRSEVQMAMPIRLMAFTGNTSSVEFPVLERFEYIQEHHMIYKETQDLRTDRLPKTDILWIGNGEIYKSGYRLNIDAEHRIKNFVGQGGVAIVSGQDVKTSAKQRRGAGWIPEPLTGIECVETYELFPTSKGKRSRIFQYPNPLNGNHHDDPETIDQPYIRLDDMWLDPLGKWTSLAKTNTTSAGLARDGFENASALLLLPFQKGLYIVTSLKNETEADVRINNKIMENLLHFSVKWLDKQRSPRKSQRTSTR